MMPLSDVDEIRAALDVLHPCADDVIEVRAIGVVSKRWPKTTSGYFDDRDALAEAAAMISPLAQGTYITLNRIDPSLLARAYNRLRGRDDSSETTADHHVVRRIWLPIDLDAVRPAGISSSDDERKLTRSYARDVVTYLHAEGWSSTAAAWMDSGNGTHILLQIDKPPEDGGFVKSVLTDLAARFNDIFVKVDATNFNPARVWKLPGTLARKGDHVPQIGRPHRLARLLDGSEIGRWAESE